MALGLLIALVPPVAVGFWPAVRPASAPVAQQGHGDHSPAAVALARMGGTAIPAGVGTAAWDGTLPEWPAGGKVFEVGQGRPYKTIGQAMFLAKDGDRVIVYGGHYHGSIIMKQRVWLDVRDGADFMGHEGSAVYIFAPGARVTGLTISHAGDSMDDEDAGIQIKDAPGAIVAGNTIRDVKFGIVVKGSKGALVAGNDITGRDEDISLIGDGIRVWYSDGARVLANTVRHTREIIVEQTERSEVRANAVVDGRQGLHLMKSPGAAVVGNFLSGNSTGIYVMYGADTHLENNLVANNRGPSGYGIGLKEADAARVVHNQLVSNRVGIYLENSPLQPDRWNEITGNLVAQNDLGVALTTSTHDNRISGNDFADNLQQVSASAEGTMAFNQWTVNGRGNHWTDYEGYDADGDGVGDLPHAPVRVFEGWMDRQPDLRWFWFTPAASAVEAAVRAFPLAAPDPILTDERPVIAAGNDRRETPWLSYRK
jgi:nitrous oxidase accessory protein